MKPAVLFLAVAASAPGEAAAEPPAAAPAAPSSEIIVTAPEAQEELTVPLGSRIARAQEDTGYRQVASDTSLSGLTPGSGMDPFAGPTRQVEIPECRSSDPALSEGAACALAAASAQMDRAEWEKARTILYRLTDDPAATTGERYVAARFFYRIAVAEGDDRARAEALEQMLATGAMADDAALAARKTLVALALRDKDDAAAIRHLEALLRAHPQDGRSEANLAALYARAGSHDKALPHMEKAVALAERSGRTPPKSWTDYLGAHPR